MEKKRSGGPYRPVMPRYSYPDNNLENGLLAVLHIDRIYWFTRNLWYRLLPKTLWRQKLYISVWSSLSFSLFPSLSLSLAFPLSRSLSLLLVFDCLCCSCFVSGNEQVDDQPDLLLRGFESCAKLAFSDAMKVIKGSQEGVSRVCFFELSFRAGGEQKGNKIGLDHCLHRSIVVGEVCRKLVFLSGVKSQIPLLELPAVFTDRK